MTDPADPPVDGMPIGLKVYRSGGFEIAPHLNAMQILSLARDEAVARLQNKGNFEAARNANPYSLEPAALATFMMLMEENEALRGDVQKLRDEVDAMALEQHGQRRRLAALDPERK